MGETQCGLLTQRSIVGWSGSAYCWQQVPADTEPMSVKCWASVPSQHFALAGVCTHSIHRPNAI